MPFDRIWGIGDGCIDVQHGFYWHAAILTMLIGQHAAIYLSLTLMIENLLIVALTLVIAEVGMQQHQVTSQLLKQTFVQCH